MPDELTWLWKHTASLPPLSVFYPCVEVSIRNIQPSPLRNSSTPALTGLTDGLDMIKEVFNASKTLELAVGRVELQKDVRACLPSEIGHF
jgi:hypothetical protein